MLSLEHSAIRLTYVKRYSDLKTIFCLLFEWPLRTDFTVLRNATQLMNQDRIIIGINCHWLAIHAMIL